MGKFANMQAFAAVGETGSFAAAARKLGLANSVVSKRIKDLEGFLGVQLLTRTTRNVTLTDTGRTYLAHVQKIFDDITEMEGMLLQDASNPTGTIKLSAPLSFGMQYLAPALSSYLAKYPDVFIRTYLSDRQVDITGEGFDMAIRIGAMADTSLIAKKLSHGRRVVCASPAYLEKFGIPSTPADLKNHNCLSYLNLAEGKSWPFLINGKKTWQPVSGNFSSDNGDLLYQAALEGCGITLLPTFIVGQAITDKKMKIVLAEYEEKDFDIFAVYPQTKHLSVKIRTLIDHLDHCFKAGFI